MTTVNISASVALHEEQHLAEHYRNRNLINAQAAADASREKAALTAKVDEMFAEIEALRQQIGGEAPVTPEGGQA